MADLSELYGLQATAGTQLSQITLPKTPYVPIPDELMRRIPQLKAWYDAQNVEWEKWREQTTTILRNTVIS